ERIDIDMDDRVFVPLSLINELRRSAVSDLMDNRIKAMESPRLKISNRQESYGANNNYIDDANDRVKLYIYTDKLIEDDYILQKIDGFGFIPEDWQLDYEVLESYVNSLKERQIRTRLVLPRIMRKEDIELIEELNPN